MFTGIVQGIAQVARITDKEGLRSFTLDFPDGFCRDLEIGASVACDGVCLTVTALDGDHRADFDVMLQSLNLTTLGQLDVGGRLNVERAAKEGAEIGGHPLSGHVDFMATVASIRQPANNHVIRIAVPAPWMRYIFPKGYIAVNGASLTVAEAGRHPDGSGWFEVWLIPETLRMTTFADKGEGAPVHIEIERQTQVMVDTIRDAVAEKIGALMPALRLFAQERGLDLGAE
ncbi:riboflavin synthase [Roseateles chitinivorans]|jgi:riboflavin synthase|uniref:Riboflavin synthase n=1 Tax=Roseateles chitinivorans TaxID=2917965 RepID=A0A2G9C7E3_9BURK|nr:riboflavin synthase subunit alpha [Roseateles chitinivorans]PIM52285.1 riboflavin synthase [Roseateles chitinivorans]